MTTNLLFADDDCDGFLAPLERRLRRAEFSVHTALTFQDADAILKETHGAATSQINSLLVDIILPFDRNGRGISRSDLGVRLAADAAKLGVSAIAFLTVVRRDAVADRYSELEHAYTEIRFGYFDKTELLSRQELKNLIEFLKVTKPTQ